MLYDNVKKVCSEKGVSVGYVEKQCELSNGSISKWNENEPGIRKVQKVADYLGVPIEKLLEDEPSEGVKTPNYSCPKGDFEGPGMSEWHCHD